MTERCNLVAGISAGIQVGSEGEIRALGYLQSIYRDAMEATTVRMRAAIECLPFENPKLSATAIATMDGATFAQALDRCLERSSKPPPLLNGYKTIDHEELVSAGEMKKPFATYRRS